MKNKRLISVIALMLIYLTGTFIYETIKDQPPVEGNRTGDKKVVGVLQFVSHPALDEIYRGIKDGLKESGLEEGRNLEINFQNGQADQSKLATMSQQLVQNNPDVLVGIATPAKTSHRKHHKRYPTCLGRSD